MYYFCTYFDKNYLDKGLALYRSLLNHCQPFKLWILCMDDDTYRTLNGMELPHVTLIPLSDFEWQDTKLTEAKQNRSVIEYYFTCTPSLILKVIEHNKEIEVLTYLDADLYFFSSIEPLYRELKYGSVLITGHNFSHNLKHLEKYGKYNVGILSFRNDKTGITCLRWWRDRCIEWCYDRLEDGKFADQKYLDDWTIRFPNVIVSKNYGVNLAPWNLEDYNGQPIIVYHYHGLKRVSDNVWDTGLSDYFKKKIPQQLIDSIYLPYLKELNDFPQYATRIRKTPTLKNYPKKLFYGDYISVKE